MSLKLFIVVGVAIDYVFNVVGVVIDYIINVIDVNVDIYLLIYCRVHSRFYITGKMRARTWFWRRCGVFVVGDEGGKNEVLSTK